MPLIIQHQNVLRMECCVFKSGCGLWNVSIHLPCRWIRPCSHVEMTRWKLCVSHWRVSSSGLLLRWDWIDCGGWSYGTYVKIHNSRLTNSIKHFRPHMRSDAISVFARVHHMWSLMGFGYGSFRTNKMHYYKSGFTLLLISSNGKMRCLAVELGQHFLFCMLFSLFLIWPFRDDNLEVHYWCSFYSKTLSNLILQ